MEGKKRYSDEELEEFRAIINQRLEVVKSDYEETMKVLMNKNTNDVNDTSPPTRLWKKAVQTKPRRSWCKWHSDSRSLYKAYRLHWCA